MIISASRRTDIPAFYAGWFIQRLREGYCLVSNPFNPQQVQRVSLLPDDVDAVVFWTKDPRPIMAHLSEIALRHRFCFQYTLNPYDRLFEPGVPALPDRVGAFRSLSARVGRERVIWRYDPIIVSAATPPGYHLRQFGMLAHELKGFTERVHISFVDAYRRASAALSSLGVRTDLQPDEIRIIAQGIAEQAADCGMEVFSCAEPYDLAPFGVRPGKCIDDVYLAKQLGGSVGSKKDPFQRPECGCVASKDIGAYGTCLHGCRYCYAGSLEAGLRNHQGHDPGSPRLLEPTRSNR